MGAVVLEDMEARDVVRHLSAWAHVLRSSFPQELIDALVVEFDDTHLSDLLRHDRPSGPEYVAEQAESLSNRIFSQLTIEPGLTIESERVRMMVDAFRRAATAVDLSTAQREVLVETFLTELRAVAADGSSESERGED